MTLYSGLQEFDGFARSTIQNFFSRCLLYEAKNSSSCESIVLLTSLIVSAHWGGSLMAKSTDDGEEAAWLRGRDGLPAAISNPSAALLLVEAPQQVYD
jgi:hypothetical protein